MKRTVCGCVVVKFTKNDAQILLVKEDGEWGLPKGGLEPVENPEDCAVRETFEETGIVVKTIGYLGSTGRLFVWYAVPLDEKQEPTPQPGEIDEAKYHSIKKLPPIEERQMPIIEQAMERLLKAVEL